jgi:8-oxo-dGTP pyrophosphatase MutT (NUDIX family)
MSKKRQKTYLGKLAEEAERLFSGRAIQQYAAICYRRQSPSADVEVLLISARASGRWIIPKGWPIEQKLPHQVAEREAWEEAGIKGKAKKRAFGYYTYLKTLEGGDKVPSVVQVHLLEVASIANHFPEHGQRIGVWLSPHDAALRVREPELRSMLGCVAAKLNKPRKVKNATQAISATHVN